MLDVYSPELPKKDDVNEGTVFIHECPDQQGPLQEEP